VLVSVIIPTFKEGLEIESFLKRLVRAFPDWQTILVDGNSRDGTVEQAHLAGVDDVLECEPSRGAQMKLGADYAKGKLLLFLHADSHLPEEAGAMLEGVARRGGKAWGAFRLRHNIPEGAGFLMRFLPATLRGSGRRFLGRPFRSSLCWHSFPILYRLGVSPERLARWYGHAR
jgi:glycosyltransferase involved in cell wall biosynthesis